MGESTIPELQAELTGSFVHESTQDCFRDCQKHEGRMTETCTRMVERWAAVKELEDKELALAFSDETVARCLENKRSEINVADQEAIRLRKEMASTDQHDVEQFALLARKLEETEKRRSNSQAEAKETEAEQLKIKKELAQLSARRKGEEQALNHDMGAEAGLVDEREFINKQRELTKEQALTILAQQKKMQDMFGSCDHVKLDEALRIFASIRKNHVMLVDEAIITLDTVAGFVSRVADDLEAPLTTTFSDQALPHLILRYFKCSAGLTISGTQARAADDFHRIVEFIAKQIRGHDGQLPAAITLIANAFDLKTLCDKFDSKKGPKELEKMLIEKLGSKCKEISMASQDVGRARRAEQKMAAKLGDLEEKVEAAPEGDKKTMLETSFKALEDDLEKEKEKVEAAEDALTDLLDNNEDYNASSTLLNKVILSFKATVDKETLGKEMEEIRSRIKAFMDLFKGTITDYATTGKLVKQEFVSMIERPTLKDLDNFADPVKINPVNFNAIEDIESFCSDSLERGPFEETEGNDVALQDATPAEVEAENEAGGDTGRQLVPPQRSSQGGS